MHKNLRSFIDTLKREGEIVEVSAEVDPYLEIAEIHRRVIDEQGKALLFTNVEGAQFPAATNLFGTIKRIELAFGKRPQEFVRRAVEWSSAASAKARQALGIPRHGQNRPQTRHKTSQKCSCP